ncbi:MAG: DUF6178 family protein [Bradymonadaceae bacterium]
MTRTELERRPTGNAVLDRLDTPLPPGDPAEQIDALLRREDADQALRSLDPPVLYRLMERAGWDQSYDLMQYVSPRQFQVFLDFDCWKRDRIATNKMQRWLKALVSESDDDHFQTVCREIDPEILPLYLKDNIEVAHTDEEQRPPEQWEGEVAVTPDGQYAVKYPEDEDDTATLIRMLIERLYDVDRVLVWTLLEAVNWELYSDMEERAYQWRNSRLEEYGYVRRDEAVEIYQHVDPTEVRERLESDATSERAEVESPETLDLPQVFRQEFDDEFFAFQAIKAIADDEELHRTLFELDALLNRAMVADGIEPGELRAGREVTRRTLGYLSLGLQFLSRGDLDRAHRYVQDVPLKKIFQVGFSLANELKGKFESLRDRPTLTLLEDDELSLLSPDDRALAESLTRRRPTWAADASNYEIFKEQDQIDDAALRLGLMAFKQVWLFSIQDQEVSDLAEVVFSDVTANPPDAVTFDLLFATRVANFLVDRSTPLAPLDLDALEQLPELFRNSPWEDDLEEYFEDLVRPMIGSSPVATEKLAVEWLERTLDHLDDEFGRVQTPIDTPGVFESVVLLDAGAID